MRNTEIVLGLGLALLSLLAICGSDHGSAPIALAVHRALWFKILIGCALVTGPAQSLSALRYWSFGRRLFALASVWVWMGLVCVITTITRIPTDGAVACLILATINMQTAMGQTSNA